MDKTTLAYLNLFNIRHSLSLIDLSAILNVDQRIIFDAINYIMDQNYIEIEPQEVSLRGTDLTPNTKLIITYLGRSALEQELKSSRRYKYGEIRAWITAIIAVAAFIKSFFF